MFEVQDLKYATLATVSRCGMVWFSEDVLTSEMLFENYMMKLRNTPLEDSDEDYKIPGMGAAPKEEEVISPTMQVQLTGYLWECSGSVVECLTRDRGAVGSSPTCVTVLCP